MERRRFVRHVSADLAKVQIQLFRKWVLEELLETHHIDERDESVFV